MIKYSAKELEHMEWWRGILAFIVVLAHVEQIIWVPVVGRYGMIPDVVSCFANASVVFFFVLSGMLISYSAMNLSADGSFNWRKYLINRITRIYPSLIFVLLLAIVLSILYMALNHGSTHINRIASDKYLARGAYYTDAISLVKAFFMVQPGITQINGPLWSLIIEWWLYISALFVFLAMNSKRILRYIFYALALIVLYPAYYGYGDKVFFYIAIWYLGFLYTMFFRSNKRSFMVLTLLGLVLLISLVVVNGVGAININSADDRVYGLVQVVYSICFIHFALRSSGGPFFRNMSKYSYTLYIVHFPIVLFVFAVLHPRIGNNPVVLFIETVVSISLVILLSRSAAKYTEDKYKFRGLFSKVS